MHLGYDYSIVKRRRETLLVNTENGDIFEINDVVMYILEHCTDVFEIEDLARITYNEFSDGKDDGFSLDDLISFIGNMILSGMIVK